MEFKDRTGGHLSLTFTMRAIRKLNPKVADILEEELLDEMSRNSIFDSSDPWDYFDSIRSQEEAWENVERDLETNANITVVYNANADVNEPEKPFFEMECYVEVGCEAKLDYVPVPAFVFLGCKEERNESAYAFFRPMMEETLKEQYQNEVQADEDGFLYVRTASYTLSVNGKRKAPKAVRNNLCSVTLGEAINISNKGIKAPAHPVVLYENHSGKREKVAWRTWHDGDAPENKDGVLVFDGVGYYGPWEYIDDGES